MDRQCAGRRSRAAHKGSQRLKPDCAGAGPKPASIPMQAIQPIADLGWRTESRRLKNLNKVTGSHQYYRVAIIRDLPVSLLSDIGCRYQYAKLAMLDPADQA